MESIRTIAGGIAHDFNNILFIIIGNVELAFEETRDWHPAHPKLETIRAAALRAAEIVKLLVHRSRRRTGLATQLMQAIEDAARRAGFSLFRRRPLCHRGAGLVE